MEYKTSMDLTAKLITIVISLIMLILIFIELNSLRDSFQSNELSYLSIAKIIVYSLILIIPFLYSPRKYVMTDNALVIKRFISSKKIPFSDLLNIRLINHADKVGATRLWAVGGLFGYFGKYRLPSEGVVNYYTKNGKNNILLVTSNSKIMISPDDITLFTELSKKVKK